MRFLYTVLLICLVSRVDAACNGCGYQFFTTSDVLFNTVSGLDDLYKNGNPAANLTPCINVGDHNMGPTDDSNYPRADSSGVHVLNDYFKNNLSYSAGTWFYYVSNGLTQTLVNWTDLGSNNQGLYVDGTGHPQVRYGNNSILADPSALTNNSCTYIGAASNGSTLYLFVTTSLTSVPVTSTAYALGTQNSSFIQFGRYTPAGGSNLAGYLNDFTFFNSFVATAPFDQSSGTPTSTPTPAPTLTPTPTLTWTYTLTNTPTQAPTATVNPTNACTPNFDNTSASLLPIMGWESYDAIGANADTATLKLESDAMQTYLQPYGWNYMNIDATNGDYRDALGNYHITPNIDVDSFVSYVHAKGQKAGFYTDAYRYQCATNSEGSYGHQNRDALYAAQHKFDYFKVDSCGALTIDLDNPVNLWTSFGNAVRYAYQQTGRRMFYEICENGMGAPWGGWGQACGGNSWKVSLDTLDNWSSIVNNLSIALAHYDAVGPGHFNMVGDLVIGTGGMTTAQYKAHRNSWAMCASPLILQISMRTMSATTLAMLTNTAVISIDQDPLVQAGRIVHTFSSSVWEIARPLASGMWAVELFNGSGVSQSMTATWSDFGMTGTAVLTDVEGPVLGTFTNSYTTTIPATSDLMFFVDFGTGTTPTPTYSPTISPTPTVTPPYTPTVTPTPTPAIPPASGMGLWWSNHDLSTQNSIWEQLTHGFNSRLNFTTTQPLAYVSSPVYEGSYAIQGLSGCCTYVGLGNSGPDAVLVSPQMTLELAFQQAAADGTTRFFYSAVAADSTKWGFFTKNNGTPCFWYGTSEVDGSSGAISAGQWYIATVTMGLGGNFVVINPLGGTSSTPTLVGLTSTAFPAGNFLSQNFQIGRNAFDGSSTCSDCTIGYFMAEAGFPTQYPASYWSAWTPTPTPTTGTPCIPSPTFTPTPVVASQGIPEFFRLEDLWVLPIRRGLR